MIEDKGMDILGSYDVVVIGAGHAGIEAAHAAATLGAKTAVFTLSLDFIGNMPCNPSIGGTAKGHLVREVDALGGLMGIAADATFLQSRMLNRGKGPAVHSLRVQTDRKRYHMWMKHALEKTPNLDIHQAEIVAVDIRDGKVCGVITGLNGYYSCKAVVIATGAFQNCQPMMAEFYSEAKELQAKNGIAAYTSTDIPESGRDTGIGHRMGCWAGGRMEAGPMASLANVSAPGPFGFAPTLILNRDGKRFMNEADFNAMGNMINRQPKGIYCNLFDANYRDIIARGGTNHGGVDFGQATYVEQWTEDMTHVADAGADGYVVRHGCLTERADMGKTPVYGAQTLEELAGYLGYEGEAVDNFVASVERYNGLCEAGKDDDFGKKADFMLPIATPPFYGSVGDSSTQAGTAVSLGGLVTDATFNVLGDDDCGIEGLYAIGNCCGGRYALTYPGILAGNSIGMAMTNGYVCGQVVTAL